MSWSKIGAPWIASSSAHEFPSNYANFERRNKRVNTCMVNIYLVPPRVKQMLEQLREVPSSVERCHSHGMRKRTTLSYRESYQQSANPEPYSLHFYKISQSHGHKRKLRSCHQMSHFGSYKRILNWARKHMVEEEHWVMKVEERMYC